jgi:hypothetical protein
MSFRKVILWAVIGLPIIWFVTDLLVAILVGPIVGDAMIMSVQAVDAIAAAVSIIIVVLVINHTMRLVRR